MWNVDFNKEDKGPGAWILHFEILKNENYKMGIYFLRAWKEKYVFWGKMNVVGKFKYEIKKCLIKFSKSMRKVKEQGIRDRLYQ